MDPGVMLSTASGAEGESVDELNVAENPAGALIVRFTMSGNPSLSEIVPDFVDPPGMAGKAIEENSLKSAGIPPPPHADTALLRFKRPPVDTFPARAGTGSTEAGSTRVCLN